MKSQIKIGPEFFAKAKNDYNDWQWAIIREFVQNSVDCDSKTIEISVELIDGGTHLVVKNDGDPMTREILTSKLLALGSSGKESRSAGSIGGFGKAKEILYFCHEWYKIQTGSMEVNGSGAEYDLTSNDRSIKKNVDGTISTLQIAGDHVSELVRATKKFASMTQWNGTLILNGEILGCDLRKGSRRKELSFGVIYSNRSHSNRVIVRINGIPMFCDYISFDGCIVVELSQDSLEALTSNRDGLKGQFRQDLMGFINELAADKSSALRDSTPRYTRFPGKSFSVSVKNVIKSIVSRTPSSSESDDWPIVRISDDVKFTLKGDSPANTVAAKMAAAEKTESVEYDFEFICKNETGMEVPDYFLPGAMSKYSSKLLQNWANVLVRVHEVLGVNSQYAVGFVFSEDCEAQYEVGPYGKVYYLNPSKIVEQSASRSRSFKKAFKLTERDRLIMIAVHEVVHGMGYGSHDENYARVLTDKAAIVMTNRKKFNDCF